LWLVLTTVLASGALCFALVSPAPRSARAAQDLGEAAFPLGSFELTERSGRTVTEADLARGTWIASFIFTRCPLSCPRISSVMKSLQGQLAGSSVRLLSISVDPENDTPPVLSAYAEKFSADPDRWWFLTGPKSVVYDLIQNRFKLNLSESSPEARSQGAEAIGHSDRLALIDRGKVVGVFDSNEADAIKDLVEEARRRAQPPWVFALPRVNACLNGLCAVMLVCGWLLIKQAGSRTASGSGPASVRNSDTVSSAADSLETPAAATRSGSLLSRVIPPIPGAYGHGLCMIAAVLLSALFLTTYLVYHAYMGSVPFRGAGLIRPVYFTILLSHTLLATFGVVPLVSLTLARALRWNFAGHARIARVTFPVWLYVSVTGVLIYLMLYQLPITLVSPVVSVPSA
jgi:protein SCO1/2/putative membrane protein